MSARLRRVAWGWALAALPMPAAAQAGPPAAQEQSQPQSEGPAPICTDRPTKANVPCTVPAGAVQVEADVASWTRDDVAGTRTDAVVPFNPTAKYGLDARTDLELNLAPFETVRTRSGNTVRTLSGVGDAVLRLKRRLTGDGGGIQVALLPFIKAPLARTGIGNGRWEGGVIVPVQVPLAPGWALTLGPELDAVADADGAGGGGGRHAQLVGLANLSHAIGRVTLLAELWGARSLDPAEPLRQHSADFAVAYLLRPTLQLDLGANIGLNRQTPDRQLYLGIASRF